MQNVLLFRRPWIPVGILLFLGKFFMKTLDVVSRFVASIPGPGSAFCEGKGRDPRVALGLSSSVPFPEP